MLVDVWHNNTVVCVGIGAAVGLVVFLAVLVWLVDGMIEMMEACE